MNLLVSNRILLKCLSVLFLLIGCFTLSGCFANSSTPTANEQPKKGKRLHFVAQCDVGDPAHSLDIKGDTAYVAQGLKGLAIVDISNPRSPRLLRRMEKGIAPVDIVVDGDRGYVADRLEGMQILDLQRRQEPKVVGKFVLPPFVVHLAVTPKLVFAACGGEGLHVLRKEKDGSLTRIGLFRNVNFTKYTILDGNIAYIADAYGEAFKIIDVSVPERMELLSSVNIGDFCDAAAKRGDFVFLANRTSGMVVMDVSDAKKPRLINRIAKPGAIAKHLVTRGNLLVVAYDSLGVDLYDVTDSTNPILLDTFDSPGRAMWVKIVGEMVYVADWQGGLLILEISPA